MRSRKAIVSAAAFVVTGLVLVGCGSSTATTTGGSVAADEDTMAGGPGAYGTGTYQEYPGNYSNTSPETPGAARPAGGTISGSANGGRLESQPGQMSTGQPSPVRSSDVDVYSSPSQQSQQQRLDINAQPAGGALPATQPSPSGQSSTWNRDNTSGSTGTWQQRQDQMGQPAGSSLPGQASPRSTTQPSGYSPQSDTWRESGTSAQPAGSGLPGSTTQPIQR